MDILKPTIGDVNLHYDSNDNGVRVVNFATFKNLSVKTRMFPQRNILKYTRPSPYGETHT
jgi:hypothetical protein